MHSKSLQDYTREQPARILQYMYYKPYFEKRICVLQAYFKKNPWVKGLTHFATKSKPINFCLPRHKVHNNKKGGRVSNFSGMAKQIP